VRTLAVRAGALESLVYLQVTRGAESGRNHLFPPAKPRADGICVCESRTPSRPRRHSAMGWPRRQLDDSRWARCDIKSIALLANVLLRQQAQDLGAAEALLVRSGA
jgi:D-alanine transaminase